MDVALRLRLIDRIKALGVSSPLVTLEEFFEGNDDYGSIGCNLSPMLGPQFFYAQLKSIRLRPDVQDVLVQIIEVEEADNSMWPFSDTVYVLANATVADVQQWTTPLLPDFVGGNNEPVDLPQLESGGKCFRLWWD